MRKSTSSLLHLVAMAESGECPNTTFVGNSLPTRRSVRQLCHRALGLLFPGYFGIGPSSSNFRRRYRRKFISVKKRLIRLIRAGFAVEADSSRFELTRLATARAEELLKQLPRLKATLERDVQAAFDRDPAVSSKSMIPLAYPGLFAVATYRIAHELHSLGVPIIPRMLTEYAHSKTGIDIHPGARIGPGFFIDHGTGVVIGETAQIGVDVTIYQGATIGARQFPRHANGEFDLQAKRHPTLDDRVTIWAGASVLGGDTFVGHDSEVGTNVTVTQSLEAESILWREKQHLKKRPKIAARPQTSAGPTYRERHFDRVALSDIAGEGCPNCADVDSLDEKCNPPENDP